jgi:hypothetical protein
MPGGALAGITWSYMLYMTSSLVVSASCTIVHPYLRNVK